MNTPLVFFIAALAATPDTDQPELTTVYQPSAAFEYAIRGQTPTYEEQPSAVYNVQPPGYSETPAYAPNGGMYAPQPLFQDPFLGQQGVYPQPGAPSGNFAFGANGPQPYRFGWTTRADTGWLPKSATEGALGQFGIYEVNIDLEHTSPLPDGWVFSATQQFNYRSWDGPSGIGLSANAYRFGWDLELATPANGPWSVQMAFNPSLNSDFEQSLTSTAWNYDGRGILFYRSSPQLMLALGAGYWDRVDDQIVPYAGVVFTPDDRWEWRVMFPQSRISYFLGNSGMYSSWLYVTGEYHVEAYEIDLEPAGVPEQIQLEDWRLLLGIRKEFGIVSSFCEAGWVFGRDVDFLRGTPGFSISDGFIARFGLRY